METIILDSTPSNIIGFGGRILPVRAQANSLELDVEEVLVNTGSTRYYIAGRMSWKPIEMEFSLRMSEPTHIKIVEFFDRHIRAMNNIMRASPMSVLTSGLRYKYSIKFQDRPAIAEGCFTESFQRDPFQVLGKDMMFCKVKIRADHCKVGP